MFKKYSLGAVCILSLLILSLWCFSDSPIEDDVTPNQIVTMTYYKDVCKPTLCSQEFTVPTEKPLTLEKPIDFGILLKLTIPKVTKPVSVIKKTSNVPDWILKGILMRETKSYYKNNGDIYYKDKTRGAAGERGPFQMTPIAFEQVAKRGDQFWKLEKDLDFAQEMAERYLTYLYKNCAHRNWRTAIMMYNTGPANYNKLRTIAMAYYNDVKSKCE